MLESRFRRSNVALHHWAPLGNVANYPQADAADGLKTLRVFSTLVTIMGLKKCLPLYIKIEICLASGTPLR
jgi:hypothetical protein